MNNSGRLAMAGARPSRPRLAIASDPSACRRAEARCSSASRTRISGSTSTRRSRCRRSTGSGPSYTFAASAYTSFEAVSLSWIELTLDLTAAESSVKNFAANDIRQIGVQFSTGHPYEGGTIDAPFDVVLHIDSLTAQ